MSMVAMVMGSLVADPVRRTGQSGKPFVTASMRVPVEGGDAFLASLIAFSTSAGEALAALAKGDQVVVGGRASLKSWTGRDGAEHHGVSIVVEQVMNPYRLGVRRKAAAGESDAGSAADRPASRANSESERREQRSTHDHTHENPRTR